MDSILYKQIVDEYQQLRSNHLITDMRVVLKKLFEKFCTNENSQFLNEDVILSIISYLHQQDQKERSRQIDWNMILDDYSKEFRLLSIAATAQLSPALVSQRIISNAYSSSLTQSQIKDCQFNSNQINNCFLAFESMLAHYSDPFYGIHYTQSSNNSGQFFEQLVEDYLKQAGVDFMNEDELRKKKYDVTPDFKLNVPVILERHWQSSNDISDNDLFGSNKKKCIKNYLITKPIEFQPLKSNHHLSIDQSPSIEDHKNITREIINWIECKSLFANEECHREYTKNQYNSYVNRFGKGIIIYNYGCIDTIINNNDEDAKFIVLTCLPEILK